MPVLIGQTVVCPTTAKTLYGPWFPREADAATFFAEVILASGSDAQITVAIEHKDSEDDDGSATTAATFTAITGASARTEGSKSATGLKELVRFAYTVQSTGASTEWLHFRMNSPIWQHN